MASKIKVDQIQTADGTGTIALQNQLSGMTYTSMPAGSTIQVTTGSSTSTFSTTSQSFQNTNLSASITPKYSNSIIVGSLTGFVLVGGQSTAEGQYQITANDSNIQDSVWSLGHTTAVGLFLPCSMTFHHSPSTTNAVTYRLTARSNDGTQTVYFYRQQYMQLMEIRQ